MLERLEYVLWALCTLSAVVSILFSLLSATAKHKAQSLAAKAAKAYAKFYLVVATVFAVICYIL